MTADDWKAIGNEFKTIFKRYNRIDFPENPLDQLRLATEAVFKSWNGKRAIDYRNAAKIAHDLGTAVNIQTMVFGNMGEEQRHRRGHDPQRHHRREARSKAITCSTPRARMWWPASVSPTGWSKLQSDMPEAWDQFVEITKSLENHYREMQDVEFTVEQNKLWMLQTRDGKRTAQAAVRIAVDMVEEGVITKEEAVLRVTPEQVDFFLHPQFNPVAKKAAKESGSIAGHWPERLPRRGRGHGGL